MNWEAKENEGLRRLVKMLKQDLAEEKRLREEERIAHIREMDDRPVLRPDRFHVVE